MVTPLKGQLFDINVTPGDQTTSVLQFRSFIFDLKAFLCGNALYSGGTVPDTNGQTGRWTVEYSCNGTPTYLPKTVSGVATNGGLVEITTTIAHGYAGGESVWIAGVGGTTPANGLWTITVTAVNKFTLDGSVFAGAYTSGGTASDGAAIGPGDYWLTKSNIITAAAGTSHSWAVLRSPSGWLPDSKFIELLIDCSASTLPTEAVLISWAQVNLVGGGVTNNPFSITFAPSGAGNTNASSSRAPGTPTNGVSMGIKQVLANGGAVPPAGCTGHFWASNDGDFTLAYSQLGSGVVTSSLWAWNAFNGETALNPYPLCCGCVGNTFGSTGALALTQMAAGASLAGWGATGATDDAYPCIPATGVLSSALGGFGVAGGLNSKHPVVPMDIWSTTSTQGLYHGRVKDIKISGIGTLLSQVPINTLEPGVDPIKYIAVHSLWLFTDGTTLVL